MFLRNTLDEATIETFDQLNDSNGRLSSSAMRDVGKYLELPAWGLGSYPKVQLLP